MANTYISELSTGVAAGSNYLVQDDGSTTSKITVSNAVASASIIGSTPMGTTATTLTGAIAEHEGDIGAINTQMGNLSYTRYTVAGGGSQTVTLDPWNVYLVSGYSVAAIVYTGSASGTPGKTDLKTSSSLSITTGANATVTLANSSGSTYTFGIVRIN